MPRTRSLAWSELKIGVLTIMAIVVAGLTIFMVMGGKGFYWQRYKLKTRFNNVAGLKSGSPVRVAGVEVGLVRDVVLVEDQVDVTLEVNRTFESQITTGSVAKLGSVSLLGESAVDITPSTRGTPIPEWGYVPQGRPAALLSDVTDQAGQGIEELTSLVHDVRQGRGTVGKLMNDEALYTELHRFVTTASDLTQGIKQGRGTIGRLMTDRQTVDALDASLKNLDASLKNIETITRQLNAGEGSLGKLLKDDSFSKSLSSATDNLDTLLGKLNGNEGTAGRLVNDPALFNRLNSVSGGLDELVAHLNDGQGTAGQLLKDKQLYENMNKVTTDLAGLIEEIKKNPKRYLNVKVSIF